VTSNRAPSDGYRILPPAAASALKMRSVPRDEMSLVAGGCISDLCTVCAGFACDTSADGDSLPGKDPGLPES
jgi:hypothetical protein